jgi:Luciferase
MKTREELNQELRRRILALPGVIERPNAGIHEDAFFVGSTMFMHIHGHGHCDIRLPMDAQRQALAEGKARPHRWAPKQGYVTALVNDEKTMETTMELIQISHQSYADKAAAPEAEPT